MNILITCYKINLSGSSTYALTLARELLKRGHKVSVLSTFIDDRLRILAENKNIKFYNNIDLFARSQNFDVIISQHNILTLFVRIIFPDTPILFISHGVIPELEQAPSVDLNINKFVVVSEECRANLLKHGIEDGKIVIVRNFVDTKEFCKKTEINEKPKRAIFLSNYGDEKVSRQIKEACDQFGIDLKCIGGKNEKVKIAEEINGVDMVFSLGRGVLESMSCGRVVIVYDYNGGDGIIDSESIKEIRKNNFSGRRYRHFYDTSELVEEIRKYDVSMSDVNRELVERDFEVSKLVSEIEKLSFEAIENFKPREVLLGKKELAWLFREIERLNRETIELSNSVLALNLSMEEMKKRKIVQGADYIKKIIRYDKLLNSFLKRWK